MPDSIQIETLRPRLEMLSHEQIQAIHHTTLDILSRTGIVMKNQAARDLLLDAGAWELEGRVRLPPHLVMDAITSAPSRIPMHNRLGQLVMPLGPVVSFLGLALTVRLRLI
jgi:trimethylamine:corrinoid methyltransferase-like protein